MMLTFALLLATLAGAVALRVVWPRLSSRWRWALMGVAVVLLVPSLLSQIMKWDATNQTIRNVEAWVRILGCQLAIVFFTLLRPRLVTVGTAVVLLPLSFTTVVAGPLGGTLSAPQPTDQPIGASGYYLETVPWASLSGGNSGLDFNLFYKRSPHAVLRRDIIGTRLYNTQCTTAEVSAALQPAHHLIDVHCPPLAADRPDAAESGTNLRYWIPRGAQSPELLSYPQHGPGPSLLVRAMRHLAGVIRSKR